MKKTILILALFVGLLITSSGFNSHIFSTTSGSLAPIVADKEISDIISQSESEGHYVLLTFWSSSDGVSRKNVNDYTAWLHANNNERIDMLAVNFDKSEKMFREIVKRDGLDGEKHFNVKGSVARQITDEFNLDKGYGTVLLSPDGRVVCVNPTPDQLNALAS